MLFYIIKANLNIYELNKMIDYEGKEILEKIKNNTNLNLLKKEESI
jgi:hypothetical protein